MKCDPDLLHATLLGERGPLEAAVQNHLCDRPYTCNARFAPMGRSSFGTAVRN